MNGLFSEHFQCQKQGSREGGEVEAFFSTIRITTHVSDNSWPFEEEKEKPRGIVASHRVVEGIKKFIRKDNVKAFMTHLEVADDVAVSLKSYDVGAVRTWVHIPTTHPGWQEVAIKAGIMIDHVKDVDCIMASR